MGLTIHTINNDNVIDSQVLTGVTTYRFAIEHIYPLINRFSSQRKLQNPTFYDRLAQDLLKGCLMPPITLALVATDKPEFSKLEEAEEYANDHIQDGYVLDGMQRLNTLNTIKDKEGFDPEKTIFLSIIISSNKDMLLYRMITLNNGQRPMTPRHQIEVLTEELFDFEELDISIQSEKDRAERVKRGSFNLSDISKGYLAFFSGSVHNDNNKIISEKMDEIIVGKIMSSSVIDNGLEFEKVLSLIDRFANDTRAKTWLMTQNNLIGFCVGIRDSYEKIQHLSPERFGELAVKFEEAFKGINAAKVNLGKYRRELAMKYIREFDRFENIQDIDLLSYFSEETAQ